MHDAAAGGQPLHVAAAEARGGAERVGMIDEAVAHDGDRLEAAVRMAGKAGHGAAVIHAPAVFALEVLAEVAPGQRRGGAETIVAGRVAIVVVDAEEERIGGDPLEAERRDAADDVGHADNVSRHRYPRTQRACVDAYESIDVRSMRMSLPDVTPPSADTASVELEIDSELQPGTSVGEYTIESKLGQGGMASVYAGVQPVIGKKVAVKVMSRQLCVDPVQIERFVQEARAVNQIGHPNIVDVFAFGALPDGRSYFVMEWLQGETLASRLRRGLLTAAEAVAIMFQICDGLAAAHDKGIVHRDLKPENIFLVPVRNRRMLVKVLDFGIAKLLGRRDARIDRTAEGATPGTPSYMSPEQARGKDVDHRSDIYALGVCAFEMLCGRLPFVGTDAVEILYQHLHAVPPAPSTLRADIPLQLERLIVQMLEKRADRRPTLPVIEERLVELRDGVLTALGDTGPFPMRALEMEHSGPHRLVTPPVGVETTDDVVLPRQKTALWVAAIAALVALVAGGAWYLTRTHAGAPTAMTPTPVAAPVAAPLAAPAPPVAAPPAPVAAPPAPVAAPAKTRPAKVAKRREREKAETPATAPSRAPAGHSRDYMIDPFATKK